MAAMVALEKGNLKPVAPIPLLLGGDNLCRTPLQKNCIQKLPLFQWKMQRCCYNVLTSISTATLLYIEYRSNKREMSQGILFPMWLIYPIGL